MEPLEWDCNGCSHYKRKCKFVTPCCNTVYTCRFCHDSKENHSLDRTSIKQMICTMCHLVQKPHTKCQKCSQDFGQYSCLECNLFDDYNGQFHCYGCGICRKGGAENFFHCETCGICLPVALVNSHKCIENVSRCNCSICLEDLHSSREPCHIPSCSHLLHMSCYQTLKEKGRNTCPVCQEAW